MDDPSQYDSAQSIDVAQIEPIQTAEPAVIAAPTQSIESHIDIWAADLIANMPQLRETDSYNKIQAAIADLKARIK